MGERGHWLAAIGKKAAEELSLLLSRIVLFDRHEAVLITLAVAPKSESNRFCRPHRVSFAVVRLVGRRAVQALEILLRPPVATPLVKKNCTGVPHVKKNAPGYRMRTRGNRTRLPNHSHLG